MPSKHAVGLPDTPSVWSIFLIALFPSSGLCIFAPGTIFLNNENEFDAGLKALLPGLLGLSILMAVVLTSLVLLTRSSFRFRIVGMLFVLGILFWLQGAFLVPDYGELDGRGIKWGSVGLLTSLDLVLWLAALVLAFLLARPVMRVAVFGSVVFIVLQSAPLLLAIGSSSTDVDSGPESAIPAELLQYSRHQNIVHIVFDNFQTDVFLDLVREQSFEENLDGFIVFRDNAASAPQTSLAVPAIFSGKQYLGDEPADVYYQQAIEGGFHVELLEHGFVVNLIPLLSMRAGPASHYFELPQVYSGGNRERTKREIAQLLDLSLFRQLPHLARKWIYNDNNWRVSQLAYDPGEGKAFQQRQFFSDYIDGLSAFVDQPVFHYVHLWPPHPPFTTTESGRSAGKVLPNTLESYRNEARPMVALLINLIDKLKAEGIYDDTFILFHSDHGGGFEPEFMPRRLLGLMASKPFDARGPLQVSDKPTSVIDVAATVLDQAGITEHSFSGHSVLDTVELARTRQFTFVHEGELYRIDISGSVYDPDSYSSPVRLERAEPKRDYQYGTLATVGMTGNGGRFLESGWSNPADRHVWSNALEASLVLHVEPSDVDLTLSIDLIPHAHAEKLPEQRVRLLINGQPITEWIGREQRIQRLEVEVPRELTDQPEMRITFSLPDAISPAEIGTGGDQSQLGVALIGFQLDQQESSDGL